MASDTKITRNHAANFDKPLMRLRNVICDISVLQTSTFGIECSEKIAKNESQPRKILMPSLKTSHIVHF